MKKQKKENTSNIEELITTGKKILDLVYLFMIVALVIGGIYIGDKLNIFGYIFTIIDILSPVFIGFIIAWLFNPLMIKINTKFKNKIFSSLLVYLIIILFIFLFISLFIPIIVEQINDFIAMIPSVVDTLIKWSENLFASFNDAGIDTQQMEKSFIETINNFGTDLALSLPSNALNILTSFFSGVFDTVLGFIIGFYMLVDFNNIQKTFIKFIPKKHERDVVYILSSIGTEVRKCVNGILLIATMVFICDTVGFAIVGLDAALLIGLFCGITDLIPYIGPYIGGGVAVLVGYTQGPAVGTGVLIIAIIVQLLENYVLQPVVMGKAASLHPAFIMIGLLLFGYFFGIIGMVFATPALAIIKVIFTFFDDKYELINRSIRT